jgi:iron(III) transport system substrate-binding protein
VLKTRRTFVTSALFAIASVSLSSPALAQAKGQGEVVLYFSADDPVARPIIAEFEKRTGITVKAVGDTEATKTTGLFERLRAEKDRPRADVVWFSEPFRMIQLANEGVLAPHASAIAKDRPKQYLGSNDLWHGFSARPRGFAVNTADVPGPPTDEFSPDQWQFRHSFAPPFSYGMFVIAAPEFGTTGGHLASVYTLWGEYEFQKWCFQNRRQEMRIVPSNAEVARTVGMREAGAGLTDADDVYAAQRNDWPVKFVPVRHDLLDLDTRQILSFGPIVLPNTVAVVKGGPNPDNAAKLADFLLSADVERMLAESEWKAIPVRPDVAEEYPDLAIEDVVMFDYEEAAGNLDKALSIFRRALPE